MNPTLALDYYSYGALYDHPHAPLDHPHLPLAARVRRRALLALVDTAATISRGSLARFERALSDLGVRYVRQAQLDGAWEYRYALPFDRHRAILRRSEPDTFAQTSVRSVNY